MKTTLLRLVRLARADPKATLLIVLVAGVLSWIGTLQYQLAAARAAETQMALDIANANARADVSHPVLLSRQQELAILGDSLRAVTKLAEQVPLLRGALDKAMGQIPRATASLRAEIAELKARVQTGAPVTADSQDVRHGTFDVRQVPFTVRVEAELPPPPARGTAAVQVAVDEARVAARLTCSDRAAHGVRAASVTLTTPTWLHATIDQVQQDPQVCGALTPAPVRASWRPAIVFGAGISVGASFKPLRAAFVGVGWSWDPFR